MEETIEVGEDSRDIVYPEKYLGVYPNPIGEQSERILVEEMYWQKKAEDLISKFGLEKVVSKNPKKRKGAKTGISVRLTPQEAKKVYLDFNFNKIYLMELIDKYVPTNTRKPVDDMDYIELRRYGHVIHGVAKKELNK